MAKKSLKIKIKYLQGAEPIEKIVQGDWIDLKTLEDAELKQGENKVINLGVAMKLPKGYEAHVVPRSSTLKKFGVIQGNHMGIIDESYCGNNDIWYFSAIAVRDTGIAKGSRICQFRIMKKMEPVEFETVVNLDGADRGGFGSTGA